MLIPLLMVMGREEKQSERVCQGNLSSGTIDTKSWPSAFKLCSKITVASAFPLEVQPSHRVTAAYSCQLHFRGFKCSAVGLWW